jgi:hypothetical protein
MPAFDDAKSWSTPGRRADQLCERVSPGESPPPEQLTHSTRPRISLADFGDFDAFDKDAAFFGKCGVTRRHFSDPIDLELLQRESEFAEIATGNANIMRGERNAEGFAIRFACKMCESELAVWQNEKDSALQIHSQRLGLADSAPRQ